MKDEPNLITGKWLFGDEREELIHGGHRRSINMRNSTIIQNSQNE